MISSFKKGSFWFYGLLVSCIFFLLGRSVPKRIAFSRFYDCWGGSKVLQSVCFYRKQFWGKFYGEKFSGIANIGRNENFAGFSGHPPQPAPIRTGMRA